jgi:hypothetical protein
MDTDFELRDFFAQVLQIISTRLPRSIKRLPDDWRPLETALTVAFERYKYLQLPREHRAKIPINDRPRPLKIVVFGGSVVHGVGCINLPENIHIQNLANITEINCRWVRQMGNVLESFFHNFEEDDDQEPLFEVSSKAWGGTHSKLATFMFKYNLLEGEQIDPDIVINGFSTNDAFRPDDPYETLQEFVRVFLEQKGGSGKNFPPLLLFLNDFQGGGGRMPEVLDIVQTSQFFDRLSSYYGFATASYADVNRDLVLGDTHESWFSPTWYDDKNDPSLMNFEVHPNMAGHTSLAWTVIYNLLNMVSTYCSLPTDALIKNQKNGKDDNFDYQAGLWGLPELSQKIVLEGKPRPPPGGIPPPLNSELKLRHVSSAWRNSSGIDNNFHSSNGLMHCPFWWSYRDNAPEDLTNQATVWDKWWFNPHPNGVGKVLIGPQYAQFVFDLSYPDTQIQSIIIFYQKSWQCVESEFRLRVWSVPSRQSNETILLAENSFNPYQEFPKTTVLEIEEVTFKKPVKAGKAFRIEAEVMGGGPFRIMGIGACGNSSLSDTTV